MTLATCSAENQRCVPCLVDDPHAARTRLAHKLEAIVDHVSRSHDRDDRRSVGQGFGFASIHA